MVALKAEQFVGPIPPPESLQGYENISPGFAERIIVMAEKQSDHRMQLENKFAESEIKDSNKGVWFAFILGLTALVAAVLIAFIGNNAAGVIGGSVLGVTGISPVAISFIKGTRISSKDK